MDLAIRPPVHHDGEVAVVVKVDEPRSHDEAPGVDDLLRVAQRLTDLDDPTLLDADVGLEPRVHGAG